MLASQKGHVEPQQGLQQIGYCAKATGSLQYDHRSEDVLHARIHNAPADHAVVIVTMLYSAIPVGIIGHAKCFTQLGSYGNN